ncbi:hypothetical protein ABVK25_007044 [Lepraria finkii]|uniref:Uncharacterized protein n=1 Tax=Lepraria finkii TaxID=1340010 RepID=A0ABR4B5X6_9LECA
MRCGGWTSGGSLQIFSANCIRKTAIPSPPGPGPILSEHIHYKHLVTAVCIVIFSIYSFTLLSPLQADLMHSLYTIFNVIRSMPPTLYLTSSPSMQSTNQNRTSDRPESADPEILHAVSIASKITQSRDSSREDNW